MADKYTLPDFAVSRIRYYDGLFLSDSDFIEEQNYHTGAQRRHEGLLHTDGITEGLDASITTTGTSIEISAGSAVDSEGRQILLAAPKTIYVDPLWGNGARFLEMSFNEAETGVADQNSTVSAATRFTQSPIFALNETQTTGAVLIAKVAIDGGLAASVDNTSRAYSGVRLPVPTGSSAIELASSNDGTTAELSSKLRVAGATTLAGALGVTGATALNSSLAVAGATVISSTLGVTGATSLANTLGVTGATSLANTLTVAGATVVNNTLGVTGNTTLASGAGSALAVQGATSINNTLGVMGNTTLASGAGSALAVQGATSINNTLGVTGNTTLASDTGSTLTVQGAATLNSSLAVNGSTALYGVLTANNTTKINSTLEATGNTTLASSLGSVLNVGGASKISNSFETTGNTTLASALGSTVTVGGATKITNTLESTGNTTLASGSGSSLTVTGGATLSSSLSVAGNTTLATGSGSSLTVTGGATLSSSLSVAGNTTLATGSGKTLSVYGATTLSSSLSVAGNTTLATGSGSSLTVTGASTFASDMTVSCGGGTNVRTLTFNNASTARILFKSSSNADNDWGYILFQNDSSFVDSMFDATDSSTENARLSIGVRNDYANLSGSKPADAVDIQGSAQLTLNAGKWDTELDSLIGSQWSETGMGSTNGISFRVDNSEKMRLNGSSFTLSTDMVLSGTRTLKFDNTSQSQIMFTSSANYGSDSAFIVYKADSSQHGTTSENGRLSIGAFNDFDSGNADALDLQGGYKLKLNAGDWDDELDSIIGVPTGTSTSYGISLCVNNAEVMKVGSKSLTVTSGTTVKGIQVIEMQELEYTISSQSGSAYSSTKSATFTQDISSAHAVISSYYFYYTNTREYVKYIGVETSGSVSSSNSKSFNVKCTVTMRDNSGEYDDPVSGTVKIVVFAILKYASTT
jgi:hypothetical protein